MLSFSKVNSKLSKLSKVTGKKVYSFSLLSGHCCPFAKECFSRVVQTPNGRRIQDGKYTKFRCFSASQEAVYTNVYNTRKKNTDLIKACKTKEEIVALIEKSLPKDVEILRVGVAGDYFSQMYLDAWLEVARRNTHIDFYSYTKSLPFLVKRLKKIPPNFSFTASRGGKFDDLIEKHGLKSAEVVYSKYEARKKGLKIDETDEQAYRGTKSFALLIHGIGPKGSKQAKIYTTKLKGKK